MCKLAIKACFLHVLFNVLSQYKMMMFPFNEQKGCYSKVHYPTSTQTKVIAANKKKSWTF